MDLIKIKNHTIRNLLKKTRNFKAIQPSEFITAFGKCHHSAKLERSSPTSNKQLAVVLSKLLCLSLPMMAIFCCRDFNLAALKTFYDGKNMPPVILGISEGWLYDMAFIGIYSKKNKLACPPNCL